LSFNVLLCSVISQNIPENPKKLVKINKKGWPQILQNYTTLPPLWVEFAGYSGFNASFFDAFNCCIICCNMQRNLKEYSFKRLENKAF